MFIFRGYDERYEKQSPSEMQAHFERWGAWSEKVKSEGYALDDNTGMVVSENGKVVTDGPFAEGKELVGGYVIVEARDYDHAVTLSKDCPIFEFNFATEIREVVDQG